MRSRSQCGLLGTEVWYRCCLLVANTHADGEWFPTHLPGALQQFTGLLASECFSGGTQELPEEHRGSAGTACAGESAVDGAPLSVSLSKVETRGKVPNLGVNRKVRALQRRRHNGHKESSLVSDALSPSVKCHRLDALQHQNASHGLGSEAGYLCTPSMASEELVWEAVNGSDSPELGLPRSPTGTGPAESACGAGHRSPRALQSSTTSSGAAGSMRRGCGNGRPGQHRHAHLGKGSVGKWNVLGEEQGTTCVQGKRNPSTGQAALSLGPQELPEEPPGQDSVLSWGVGLARGAAGCLGWGSCQHASQRHSH